MSSEVGWKIAHVAIIMHLQSVMPIASFVMMFVPDFNVPLGFPYMLILFLLSVFGFVVNFGIMRSGVPYGVNLDEPLDEGRLQKSRKFIIPYSIVSLLVYVAVFLLDGLMFLIPTLFVIPNLIFVLVIFRRIVKIVEDVNDTYAKMFARKPSGALFEDDVIRMFDERDSEALIGVLESADQPNLRALAAEFLGKLDEPNVGDELSTGLADDSEEVQFKTAIALCHYGLDYGASLIFEEKWDEYDVETKLAVIDALLALNDSNARWLLEQALEDDDSVVASRALEALLEARRKADKLEKWEPKEIPGEM